MKYIDRQEYNIIKNKYSKIIAWGTGPIFKINYNSEIKFNYVIDGTGKTVGKAIKGNFEIKNKESLFSLNEEKVLVVIYAIYEKEITEWLKNNNLTNVDTIIYSFLDCRYDNGKLEAKINAKNSEDYLLMMLIKQLEIEELQYLEIGVCHPVIRNNTFLLNEQYSHKEGYKGVLVEANPLCWNLIKEYRSNDVLVEMGVSCSSDEKLPFYVFPGLLGHSTFMKDVAEEKKKKGYEYKIEEIETGTLDKIISDNFDRTPDLLAIDAEGLDYLILKQWDEKKYPFKIVCNENGEEDIDDMMTNKGYIFYAKTLENTIWYRNDYKCFV